MRMDEVRRPDAATLFTRALRTDALAAGHSFHLAELESRSWSSATFIGDQFLLEIIISPRHDINIPGVRSWLAGLTETEFSIRGHIVADLAIDAIVVIDAKVHATIAVLTLIDA